MKTFIFSSGVLKVTIEASTHDDAFVKLIELNSDYLDTEYNWEVKIYERIL